MYSYSYCACITYSICAHTQQRAKCSSLESEEKKTDATTHFEFFFNKSSFRTKLAPQTHIFRREKERKKTAFFVFFAFFCSLISTFELNRPRRRSQEPTERVDVCLSQQQKRHRFHSLLVYSFIIYRVFIIIIYELFIQQREREKETRV